MIVALDKQEEQDMVYKDPSRTYFTGETIQEHNEPLGLEGDKRSIDDFVRSDSAIRELIKERDIKGVPVYTSYGDFRSTRYIIPLRKGELLIAYEQPEALPINSVYDDTLEHYFISYYYKNGKVRSVD